MWSCLVVFHINPVLDEIVFGYMYESKCWMFDMWASASCMNQVVLYGEGSSISADEKPVSRQPLMHGRMHRFN